MLQMLESQERAALRAVVRAASEGDAWLMQVAAFVRETIGLGPAVLCIVGLLPPLINFANPAKLWKYLGLHVLPVVADLLTSVILQTRVSQAGSMPSDQEDAVTQQRRLAGRAPRRPTCGPSCEQVDCPHDRWSFHLKAYAIAHIVPPIIRCLESPYRPVYDQRKAHTAVTHPEWATEHPSAPKLHYERDAQRYVAKRVWRDVWCAAQ